MNETSSSALCAMSPLLRSRRAGFLTATADAELELLDAVPDNEACTLPRRWVLFTDLHVQKDTLPTCVRVLRRVAAEAQSRDAGIICLGDFWHAGGMLHTRQLNRILDEIRRWDMPVLMIPGNHDQAMRGNPDPLLHALTPLGLASPSTIRVFSRPTRLADSLWVPYGTSADELRAACARAQAHAPLAAVFCHADIVGGLMNEGVAATRGLPPDAFPPLPTIVYSGHYHKPHTVAEPTARGRLIRYAGSPYQTSMAEAGQRKALLVLDRERGWAVEDEVPLDLGPRHHVLRAPLHEQLLTLAPALRQGDRLLLLSAEVGEGGLAAFAAEQRRRGVNVELRAVNEELPNMELLASTAAAQLGAAGGGGGADQPDLLQPAALFAAYADAKNLSAPLRALATTLLDASLTAAGSAFVPPPPVRLSLSSVSVEGFGCFESALVYPLERRGLLLLRGATASESNNAGAGADVSDEGDDGEVTASNGAGKTTLAMAPLWALTGSTDARADGKPIEARGVIHDGSARAVVTLRGSVQMMPSEAAVGGESEGGGRTKHGSPSAGAHDGAHDGTHDGAHDGAHDGGSPSAGASAGAHDGASAGVRPAQRPAHALPFEVTRTMGKREHTLSFRLGDTVHEGTLAQVQEQLDAALQSTQLARTIFFGQHGGGGLLDKTDAALKAELQALLPLELWENVRETARLQVRLIATDCD